MIAEKADYDKLTRTGELVVWMNSKFKTVAPRTHTRKGGLVTTNGPTTITDATGEQRVMEKPKLEVKGCPVKEGDTAYVRWREEKPEGWSKGDPLPPLRGGILVVFVEGVLAVDDEGNKRWRVTFRRTSKHYPAPDKTGGVYLASAAGYASRSESIDPEASVIPNEDVERIRADELAHRRAIQRAKVGKIKEQIAEVAEGEQDTEVRRKLTDLDRTADYLASILTDEDRAA